MLYYERGSVEDKLPLAELRQGLFALRVTVAGTAEQAGLRSHGMQGCVLSMFGHFQRLGHAALHGSALCEAGRGE